MRGEEEERREQYLCLDRVGQLISVVTGNDFVWSGSTNTDIRISYLNYINYVKEAEDKICHIRL